jgi:CheY-like chemotaxis protein
MRIEKELLDLIPALEEAAESVRPIAASKGIVFSIEAEREPLFLSGDSVRLQQVIINLLQNAIKFTSSGGRVTLVCERVGPEVVLTVADTGIGIDPEFLPMIFDRFSQADASTRRNNTGLGLGLTIVRTIVELHGGAITAESEGPGRGAVFTIKLPLSEEFYREGPVTSADVSDRLHSTSLEGVKILLVDDDEDGIGPLRLLLEREKADVSWAISAAGALEQLRNKDFHILISDIGMPKMDGFELISELRQGKAIRNKDIKAIAYTAYASEEDKARVLASGYQAHLAKPLDMDELLGTVKKLGVEVFPNGH